VQRNHNHDAALYVTQARQRMLAEFKLMTACAASLYIVDAFAAGSVAAADGSAALPAILMEFAELGDVQQSLIEGRVKQQIRFPGLSPKQQPQLPQQQQQQRGGHSQQQQQQSCGLSSATSQRIVRAAALGLRDLHNMTGHIHCDMKTNNLLVRIAVEDCCVTADVSVETLPGVHRIVCMHAHFTTRTRVLFAKPRTSLHHEEKQRAGDYMCSRALQLLVA
jgi:hypothetical protein